MALSKTISDNFDITKPIGVQDNLALSKMSNLSTHAEAEAEEGVWGNKITGNLHSLIPSNHIPGVRKMV